jgi:hypothetical protein
VNKVKKVWGACRACGSTEIQVSAWTHYNKAPHEEGFFTGGDSPVDNLYCSDCCDEDASVVDIIEYEDGTFSKPEKNRFTYYPTLKEAWLA